MLLQDDDIVRILLVEDDPADVFLIRRALEDAPVKSTLECCPHGLAALNLLKAMERKGMRLFDLVLLDLRMPVMDGMEFLEAARAIPAFSCLPVVVLTGVMDRALLDRALKLGANAACNKSSSQDAMNDIVQSVIDLWSGTMWLERPFLV